MTCKTIAVVGAKGGSGKSTLAIHLSAEWVRRGYRVALVDCDPQQSAARWISRAAQHGGPAPELVPAVDENSVAPTIRAAQAKFDVVVCDTAGRADPRAVYAAGCADLALCPVNLHSFDMWALNTTLGILRNVQAIRPDLRGALVVNQAGDIRTRLGKEAMLTLEQVEGMELCPVHIGRRIAFAEAALAGEGVTTYDPKGQAAVEIALLADWCIPEMEVVHGAA